MEQNKALLERIRLFVLDLDGTIYLGDRLLPGAAEFITTAKEKGRRAPQSGIGSASVGQLISGWVARKWAPRRR